jgi:lysozyme
MLREAERLIKYHEGCELFPYKDTKGILTVGYGRNLDEVGISSDEALGMLANDIKIHVAELQQYPFWKKLNDHRRAAMIDFHFNVGDGVFREFKKTLKALEEQEWEVAAEELLDSQYAKQVGGRSSTIAGIIRTGKIGYS